MAKNVPVLWWVESFPLGFYARQPVEQVADAGDEVGNATDWYEWAVAFSTADPSSH